MMDIRRWQDKTDCDDGDDVSKSLRYPRGEQQLELHRSSPPPKERERTVEKTATRVTKSKINPNRHQKGHLTCPYRTDKPHPRGRKEG